MDQPIRLLAFGPTGVPLFTLPYTACTWSESISEAGHMQATVAYSDTALHIPGGLWQDLKVWGIILAAVTGRDVIHAGWLTGYEWDASSRTLSLDCGGGWTVLSKRLVLNHALDQPWKDGELTVDIDHPAGDWLLRLKGTYQDIAAGLVAEALKWGALPIDLPAYQGGGHVRDYSGYDLATVADRLTDLSRLEDGDEIRMDPVLAPDGTLRFRLRSQPEIVDHDYTAGALGAVSATAPDTGVRLTGIKSDGADMTTQVYATGGKGDDKTLICRDTSPINGIPLLQTSDTAHTTVSDLQTLQAHARSDLAYGARPDVTYTLDVTREYPLSPGDHMDVTVEDDFAGERQLKLKITDTAGASDSEWQQIQARERA